jgi:hypothetical protein
VLRHFLQWSATSASGDSTDSCEFNHARFACSFTFLRSLRRHRLLQACRIRRRRRQCHARWFVNVSHLIMLAF